MARGTYAFFVSAIRAICFDVWQGARQHADELGVDLHTFTGDLWKNEAGMIPAHSRIFRLPDASRYDGLLVYAGALAQFCSPADLNELLAPWKGKPVVAISGSLPGAVSIDLSNYSGVAELTRHLVRDHGARKVGFVKGPEGHGEAEERYRAYCEVLKAEGISLDPALVAPGDFSVAAGIQAVDLFFKQRHVNPEAIVCVDDETAIGVMEACQRMGIKVPGDCAVVGFDDISQAAATVPPMTTVMAPVREMGRTGLATLVAMAGGQHVTDPVKVPTTGVIRQSCGCADMDLSSFTVEVQAGKSGVLEEADIQQWIQQIGQVLSKHSVPMDHNGMQGLAEAFRRSIVQKDHSFLDFLQRAIEGQIAGGHTLGNCQACVAALRSQALPWLGLDRIIHGETLFHQAQTLVAKAYQFRQNARIADLQMHTQLVQAGIEQINHAFTFDDLWSQLDKQLPVFGMDDFLVCRYEEKRDGLCDMAALETRMVYSRAAGISSEANGIFEAGELVPSSWQGRLGKCPVIAPLSFGDDSLGYFIAFPEPERAETVNTLRSQLSSIVQRILMDQERNARDHALETRNQAIQERVGPMIDAIAELTLVSRERTREIEGLGRVIDDSGAKLGMTQEAIRNIADNASAMLKTIELIDDIAESVNVLAINAAIESAHAGTWGRGFSVIAKEIRKLSDSTADNSRTIGKNLKLTIANIKGASDAGKASMESYEAFRGHVEQLLSFLHHVDKSLDQLSQGSREILAIMHHDERNGC